MKDKLLPLKYLAEFGRMLPGVWRDADMIRSQKGDPLPDWPGQVFLPMNGWMALARRYGLDLSDMRNIFTVEILAALAAWRPGQDVIQFDASVYESVKSMPLDGKLPCEVLWRLPAWAVYVKTPNFILSGREWDGFIARLDMYDKSKRCLRMMFLAEDQNIEIPLILEAPTLKESFAMFFENARQYMGGIDPESQCDMPAVERAVNLLLYICSYGFADKEDYAKPAGFPAAKKTKHGWRLFPPNRPAIHNLGREFGDRIRQTSSGQTGSHAGKRPHIRRAHWHGYWKGPKRGTFILHWLPPIAVAMGEDDE